MSRDTQAGANSSLPPRSTSLKAATPPSFTGPYEIGNFACECTGPQNGASTHRVPLGSSHELSAPQLPMSWKSTSSLRSEEHTSELQSQSNLVCRLLPEKKKNASRGRRCQTQPFGETLHNKT